MAHNYTLKILHSLDILDTNNSDPIPFVHSSLSSKLTYNVDYTKTLPEVYITYWDGDKLIGVFKQLMLLDFMGQSNRTIMYIVVDKNYQNQGISKSLIDEYINLYKDNNLNDTLVLSPYSKDGYTKLKTYLTTKLTENSIIFNDSYCFES